jgi:hypothetical protein
MGEGAYVVLLPLCKQEPANDNQGNVTPIQSPWHGRDPDECLLVAMMTYEVWKSHGMGDVAAAQNASRMFRDCLLQNLWDD